MSAGIHLPHLESLEVQIVALLESYAVVHIRRQLMNQFEETLRDARECGIKALIIVKNGHFPDSN